MTVWAVVPIKPLNRAKSRLSGRLSPRQREKLALGMLHYNLRVLTHVSDLAGVLVISRDMKALAAAREISGVQTLQESGTPELNNALNRACRMLISWNVTGALILPADVPLVSQADIEAILALGQETPSVVLCPDRFEDGTNAMFARPPDALEFGFGAGSFQKHRAFAHNANLPYHIYHSERLELDVDNPEDLEAYERLAEKLGEKMIDFSEEQSNV